MNADDLDIGLKANKNFKRSMIPDHIWKLHGKRVRIYGNMQATYEQTITKGFMFSGETRGKTYGNGWSGSGVPLNYLFPVHLRPNTKVEYTRKPIVVEGRFLIRPWVEDGKVLRLYMIKDATVKPAKDREGFHRSVWPGGC